VSLQTYYGFSKGTLGQTSLLGLAAADFGAVFNQLLENHGHSTAK